MLEFLLQNWFELLVAAIMIIVGIVTIKKFLAKPTEEQIKIFKNFLLAAVISAEKELGSGTGVLKLQAVYKEAVQYFPFIALTIPYKTFELWVDEAIVKMKELLAENEKLATFVMGDSFIRSDRHE